MAGRPGIVEADLLGQPIDAQQHHCDAQQEESGGWSEGTGLGGAGALGRDPERLNGSRG